MSWKEASWVNISFISAYHALLLIFLPIYLLSRTPSWSLLAVSFAMLVIVGLAITVGYHRLYAHRAFQMNSVAQFVTVFFGAMAIQNSVLCWARDHRIHHQFSDTEKDPYSVKDGFWHAHLLWILKKSKTEHIPFPADLAENKIVRFQHKWYVLLAVISNIGCMLLAGWVSGDYFGAFVFALLLRIFISHHMTWLINSWAHTWGKKQFASHTSAVNNWLLAFFTFGEGYHDYHHTFPSDYRNGAKWYHFDPSKWTIWIMAKVRLASSLMKVNSELIRKKELEKVQVA